MITFAAAIVAVCIAPLLLVVGTVSARRDAACRTLGSLVAITSGLALLVIPASMLAARLGLGAASLGSNSGAHQLLVHVTTDPAYDLPRQALAGLALLSVWLYALLVYRRSAAGRQAPADRF